MKAKYWILTIPAEDYEPSGNLPDGVVHIAGQKEQGESTGYTHWQAVVTYDKQVRLSAVKKTFGSRCHAEPTRSAAAREYVWKESTFVDGSRFEFGKLPVRRNCSSDWAEIYAAAKSGDFDRIPPGVVVRNYGNLQKIASANAEPIGLERVTYVYWGVTGAGKSRTAWSEAGLDAYPKDPCTKFWDGYRGQGHVVIDEFRGTIGISHLLRWLDRYPVLVEIKGSSTVLRAEKIWITSNLHPRDWYKDLDALTVEALLRRLVIKEFPFVS